MKKQEAIPSHVGRSRLKTWMKRMSNRLLRRLGRVQLDQAPQKLPRRGWWW